MSLKLQNIVVSRVVSDAIAGGSAAFVRAVIVAITAAMVLSPAAARAATFTITSLADNGRPGEWRGAIESANATPGSTIVFQSGLTGTITLASATPTITTDAAIVGPGSGSIAIDGAGKYNALNVNAPGGVITVSGLTFKHGLRSGIDLLAGELTLDESSLSENSGDGLDVAYSASAWATNCKSSGNAGVGANVAGTATMTGCDISGNDGGIGNSGQIALVNCTVADNSSGAGVANSYLASLSNCLVANNGSNGVENDLSDFGGVRMTLTNCTINGNAGSGLFNSNSDSGSDMTLVNCTVTANADFGLYNGINNSATLTNSVLYADMAGEIDNIGSGSASHCDIESGLFGLTDDGGNIDASPMFAGAGLANNGGRTETIALLNGSPCYRAGTKTGAPVTDQRGVWRPSMPSIGAFDYGTPLGTIPSPTFTPNGGILLPGDTVSLHDSTSSTSIFYTTDGSAPTASSMRYSAPIDVSSSETISAIAGGIAGYYVSAPSSATFTFIEPRFDFNRDGKDDLLWEHSSTGDLVVWYMNGSRESSSGGVFATANTTWQVKGVGDISGNGYPDLLWWNSKNGDLIYWEMSGAHELAAGSISESIPNTQWQPVSMADFNGDGHPDILWENVSNGQLEVWYLDGGTVEGESGVFATVPADWRVAGTADFNLDGHPDLLIENMKTGAVVVWYLGGADGTTVLQKGSVFATVPNTDWQIVSTGDTTGDGHPDLTWRNSVSGKVVVWLMGGVDGTTIESEGAPIANSPPPAWDVVGVR